MNPVPIIILASIVAAVSFVVFSSGYAIAADADKFTVTFGEPDGLTEVCIPFSMHNEQEEPDDIAFRSILNQTSAVPVNTDVSFYERKREEYDIMECNDCVIQECDSNATVTCYDINVNDCDLCGNTTSIGYSYRWVERNLISRNELPGELSNQFEEIHMRRDETRHFKICYDFSDMPMNPSTGMPGSYGFVWLDIDGSVYADTENSSWWNLSFGFRYRIIGNASSATLPIGVNATNLPNYWTQNNTNPIYLYCTVSGCMSGLAAVANDTTEMDWENASSRTGNNPTLVYEPDIVGFYHLEDIGGATAADSTRYGNDLTHINTPAVNSTGLFGFGVNYEDGSSEYSSGSVRSYSTGTVLMWVNQEASAADEGFWGLSAGAWAWANIAAYSNTIVNDGVEFVAADTNSRVCNLNTGGRVMKPGTWQLLGYGWNITHCWFSLDGVRNKTVANTDDPVEASANTLWIANRGTNALYLDGTIDEVIYSNRSYTDLEVMDVYLNGINQSGRTGAQEVPTAVANTSLLGASFNISDFTFASTVYVTAFNGNFSTGDVDLILLSSMNIEKISGGGTNTITTRIRIDGSTIVEEDLRTVTGIGDSGSVGIRPSNFNISSGNHNITYEFKRTGIGSITISNIDSIILQTISNASNNVRGNITNVSYTHSSTSFVPAFNFTINKTLESRTYYTIKQTVEKGTIGSSTLSYYFEDFDFNHTTPFWQRVLTGASDIGSVSGVYLDSPEVGLLNYTIQSRQTDAGDTISVNGSVLDLDLIDSASNVISGFQTSNPLTNLTNNISLGAGTHNLANFTIRLDDGDSYFLSMSSSFSSTSGAQTPTYLINSTNSTVPCNSSKSRFLSDNDDIGNAFIYMICPSLTAGNDYAFSLWVTVQAGETITQIDESFNGFEITAFDISIINTAPVVAIIDPDDGETVSGNVTINWTTTDFQGDSYLTNITLTNATATINISVNLPQSTSNITWDSAVVSNGRYNLTVISFENATVDNLAGNNTVAIVVNNIPIIIPTVCRVEPVLITNQDNEEIEIGWAFDCSQILEGTFFGDMLYAEMHFHNDPSNSTTTISSQNVWVNLTGFNTGQMVSQTLNGFTYASDTLTALVAGKFKVTYSLSFGNVGNNQEYQFAIAIDNILQNETDTHRKVGSQGDVGNVASSGFMDVSVGDHITLMVRNNDGTGDVVTHSANVNLIRIGD